MDSHLSSFKQESSYFVPIPKKGARMSSSDDNDNPNPGLSKEELKALEDKLLQQITAKVKPGESSKSPPKHGG